MRSSIRREFSDIEERLARVTNSKQTYGDVLRAVTDSSSTRESRMEVAAWIAICQFNCRVFGGFVRDWIVGGYSAKPTSDIPPSEWITYNLHNDCTYQNLKIPHIIKQIVPNDIDCELPRHGFDIDQFRNILRHYGFDNVEVYRIQRGYLLLLDKDNHPFTMDLIKSTTAFILHKYRILDCNVNKLYIEKDCIHQLGMRCHATKNHLTDVENLENIVKNIKEKRFKVLRGCNIKDRTEKFISRGWTQIETGNEVEDMSNEYSADHC